VLYIVQEGGEKKKRVLAWIFIWKRNYLLS